MGEPLEPARNRYAVIVGKGQVFALGLVGAGIPGRGRSRIGLAQPGYSTIESMEILRVERWLAPIVDRVIPLADAPAAYDLLASDATFGKVILDCT